MMHLKVLENSEAKNSKTINRKSGNISGKVGVPILLYFLGVPGIFVIAIWLVFFRG